MGRTFPRSTHYIGLATFAGSDPRFGRQSPAADSRDERLVVALRLVGVCDGERGDRLVESPARTEVAGDLGRIARPCVCPGERPRTHLRVQPHPGLAESRDVDAVLHVV